MRRIIFVLVALALCACADKPPAPNFAVSEVKRAASPSACKRRVPRYAPPTSAYDADGAASFGAYTSATDQYDSLAGRFNACQSYYERELGQK